MTGRSYSHYLRKKNGITGNHSRRHHVDLRFNRGIGEDKDKTGSKNCINSVIIISEYQVDFRENLVRGLICYFCKCNLICFFMFEFFNFIIKFVKLFVESNCFSFGKCINPCFPFNIICAAILKSQTPTIAWSTMPGNQ